MTVASEWSSPVLAVLLMAAFGMTLTSWIRHVHPALGARLLLLTSALSAAAMLAMLAMLALPLAGQSDVLADYGHWSEAVFARGSLSAHAVAVAAALAVAVLIVRAVGELRAQRRAGRVAEELRASLGADVGQVVVAASDEPEAMALASGVIVVTAGLIRALDPEQRRAVLTHERAHVTYRHHRYLQAGGWLVALNPLLFRVPDAFAYLTERWADEEAARATSRTTTAAALEAVALISADNLRRAPGVLGAAAVAVDLRIRALRAQPPSMAWTRLLFPFLLVISLVGLAIAVGERTLDLVQLARI